MKVTVKKKVKANWESTWDLVSSIGVPNKPAKTIQKFIYNSQGCAKKKLAFSSMQCLQNKILDWNTTAHKSPGSRLFPVGMMHTSYELHPADFNQTTVIFTVRYDSIGGFKGLVLNWLYGKFQIKRLAKRNLIDLSKNLTANLKKIAA
ncbi:MAG: hypothetical protein KI790_05820 [Cyclobacteriaceae bacterium]|nr:hypothetical protein [Cyclobacteriaceae bacterium HetDA_MAG_MS6]